MEDQFISYLTCEACRYTFVSGKDLIQCPDCGKPQVRKATEKEIDDWKCEKCGCTKSSGYIFSCVEVPEEYKDDKNIIVKSERKVFSKCGHETREPFESYSGSYDLIKVLEDGSFLCRQKDDYEDKLKEFFAERKRQYEEAEQYLMSIGEITTIEYEDEYADKYYGEHFDRNLRRMMRFSAIEPEFHQEKRCEYE